MKLRRKALLISLGFLVVAATIWMRTFFKVPPLPSEVDQQRQEAVYTTETEQERRMERACSNPAYGCAVSVVESGGAPYLAPPQERHRIAPFLLVPLATVTPVYPANAKNGRLEGDVGLRLRIGATGVVQSAEPTFGDPVLQSAAVSALESWRFRPYLLSGAPVPTESEITVQFRHAKVTVCLKERYSC